MYRALKGLIDRRQLGREGQAKEDDGHWTHAIPQDRFAPLLQRIQKRHSGWRQGTYDLVNDAMTGKRGA